MPGSLIGAPARPEEAEAALFLEMAAWYEKFRPLVEQLADMSQEWRHDADERLGMSLHAGDAERRNAELLWRTVVAVQSEFTYAAIRLDLRLAECRRAIQAQDGRLR